MTIVILGNDMTNIDNDGLNLDDPDRLPWLDTADGYEYDNGASPLRVAAMVLGGLALLAFIVGGIYWVQRNRTAGTEGNGQLIAAQEGDYKVRPENPEGKTFDGEGDAAFAASQGKKTDAVIASGADAAKPAAAADANSNAPVPAGSALVQLGAYSDAASADVEWTGFVKRFGFLSGMNHKITQAAADGGRKVFRLQAVAGDAGQAQQLCAKIRAAGESCLIVK